MADFNEILGNVGELSDDELTTHSQSALEEFKTLQEQDATEENVNRMTEIADFVSTIKEEEKAREVRKQELATAADDAASRIAELTDTTEEDEVVEEELPVEEVKEDLEEEEDFASTPEKDKEDDEELEEVVVVDEEEEEKKAKKPFSDESGEAAELAVEDTESPEELASEDKAEDKADADAEAKDENKENEEDKLFTENTEENNVATTPDELSVQDAPENKSAGLEVTITAGADIPGYGLGAELTGLSEVSKAFSERLRAIGTRGTGNGEQHTVASFNINYPEDRRLSQGDRLINEARMDSVASPQAVTAAGGICAPLPIDETIETYGSTARPVRDSLPSFNAERGGVIYITPPALADLSGAVNIWTLADDYAAIGADLPVGDADKAFGLKIPTRAEQIAPAGETGALGTSVYPGHISGTGSDVTGPVKPCVRITCGDEIRAYVDAIPLCLTVGNMQARAYPELIEKHLELAMVWQSRFAEQRLLTRIGNLSTKVTTEASHGITRDFLNALSLAVAGFRNRHRLDDNFRLRTILPSWFRDAIRADMILQIAGDGQDATFGLTNATIDRWIADRGVNVTWTIDGEEGQHFSDDYEGAAPVLSGSEVTPGGAAQPLENFPSEVVWYLFPEGGFVFLDGGTLDLGVVRDSTLNSKNDYQIFVETFEGLIKRAPESFRVTTPVNILGATTGTVDPVLGS